MDLDPGCISPLWTLPGGLDTDNHWIWHSFNGWNNFGRGILLLLMFVGGCAWQHRRRNEGDPSHSVLQILRLEIEKAHRPRVVRLIGLADPQLMTQRYHIASSFTLR